MLHATEEYPTWVDLLAKELGVTSGEGRSWYAQFAAHPSLNQRCLCQIVYLWPGILARCGPSLSHTALRCLTYWLRTWPTWLFSSVSSRTAASTALIYDQAWRRASRCCQLEARWGLQLRFRVVNAPAWHVCPCKVNMGRLKTSEYGLNYCYSHQTEEPQCECIDCWTVRTVMSSSHKNYYFPVTLTYMLKYFPGASSSSVVHFI